MSERIDLLTFDIFGTVIEVARGLGLTCVFVERPHHRPGPHEHRVRDLKELSALLAAT